MSKGETVNWIEGTPIGVDIREINYIAPHIHEDIIEITLCLSGSIKFSYCFEEFTLRQGDFILVDRDTHYLYDGEDAVCASFYIDLNYFEEDFPYIKSLMFVCEGTEESSVPYDTYDHKHLKGMLLSLLLFLSESGGSSDHPAEMTEAARKIVDIMMDKFDIIFYYNPALQISEKALMRHRLIIDYLYTHSAESITIGDIAKEFGLSEAYTAEFMSKYILGFRKMLAFIRMSKAEKLLFSTDMTIVQISETCNFSDPKYMYETFDYWFGCTPNQFKKKYVKEMKNDNVERFITVDEILPSIMEIMKTHFVDTFL